MRPEDYPFPLWDEDGFELRLLEESEPGVASDEERFGAEPGDMVKLIFRYKDPVRNSGSFNAERMWVEIVSFGEGCLVGRLDNNPQYTDLLKSDDTISFHPKHILCFWDPSA
ncbi:uncharacterized protein DUF2314 [Roseimicrobium gellanilyticum]|uniref:Uncharacterized protein DUF2314 n=1 Tax=Roseimicrobium gellanilyticum TaxID=748857 RepID=A0A366HLC8_9BACT|nr:DUF2314 domain-containing protein [Roseimicrobium gellanilyticum]RBP42563.1 uncharacterized protein DUF2314 [Roseimicrobium gellanilyticum]